MKKLISVFLLSMNCLLFSQVSRVNPCSFDILKIVDKNLGKLSPIQMERFLSTYDKSCGNNAEFSEWSNKLIYLVLEKQPLLFLEVLDSSRIVKKKIIYDEIADPTIEGDLILIYKTLNQIDILIETRNELIKSIELAAKRIKLKLPK